MNKKFFGIAILLTITVGSVQSQLQVNNSWHKIESTGTIHPRHENAFVEVKGNFYLLGGRRIQAVNIFNPNTSTWTEASKPPMEIHHFQAVTFKNEIYLAGAMTGKFPREKAIDKVYIYNPKNDTWRAGFDLPSDRLRGSSGTVIYKDKLYLVCGIIDGHYDGHVDWFDSYDFKTGTWEKLPNAPRVRDHFHAVVINDKLYAAGGRVTSKKEKKVFSQTIPEIDVFDFNTNTWSTLKTKLPTLRAGTSTIAYGKYLIVIGGESGSLKTAHNQVEVLDTESFQWIEFPALARGRHGTQTILYKDAMYIASGSGNRGGNPELNSIEKYSLK